MVFILGTFLNRRTASVPSNQSQQQQHPFYQQQVQQQAQQAQIQSREKQPSNWIFPETNNDQNQDGKGYYSSYGDYDRALDQRTNQVYNESREKNQTNQHYK